MRHMVKDHSDERKTHWHQSFRLAARDLLYIHPTEVVHATTFVIPILEHWLEWKIALPSHFPYKPNETQQALLMVLAIE